GGGIEQRNPQLIISLTSYPKRNHILHHTLYSLFTQNLKPNKIILYLTTQEYPQHEANLPDKFLAFQHKGLEIKWVKENFKPYKKLVYALQDFPRDIIVTADDDTIYPSYWLERLYHAYTQAPQYIHAHRVHKISLDKHNQPLPYNDWESCIDFRHTTPSFLHFFTGVGGVLYPPHSLGTQALDSKTFMGLCPTGDDIWFWAMAVCNDVKCNAVENNIREISSFECEGNPYGISISRKDKMIFNSKIY
ncbi:hypothetical protein, partial [uncultured Helicobacter sp.]